MKIESFLINLFYSESSLDKKLKKLKADISEHNIVSNSDLQEKEKAVFSSNKIERLKNKIKLKDHYNTLINEYYEVNIL